MAAFTAEFSVPVYITVENGRIISVMVDDEALDLSTMHGAAMAEHPCTELQWEDACKVRDAISECEDWPAWSFG